MGLLKRLEQMINPIEIADYLQLHPREVGGKYLITCPFCGSSMWLLPDACLCANDECRLLAGSSLELVVAREGSYDKALTWVWRVFRERLERLPDFHPDTFVQRLATQARQRRNVFKQVRQLMRPDHLSSSRQSVLDGLGKHGIHDPSHALIGVLLPSEHEVVYSLAEQAGAKRPVLPDFPLLFIPYWTRPDEPAALLLMHPRGQWSTLIPMQEYKVALAGIHGMGPETRTVSLHATALQAGMRNAVWKLHDPSCVSMAVLLSTFDANPHLPSVVIGSEGFGPASVARLYSVYPQAEVAGEGFQKVHSYDGYIYSKLLPRIKNGQLDAQGLAMLSAFNPQGEVRHKLHQRLSKNGYTGPADQVARALYNIEIARSDRMIMYETPEGYGVRRSGGPIELFSNFIVRMNGNVAFGDQTSLHHAATILINGQGHDTVLPARLLDQPRELVEHVHQLLTLKRNTTVPMLRDPNSFRSVAFYLRGLVPVLPSQQGIPFLGWTHQRDAFFMPGSVLTLDGPKNGPFPFHPSICVLDAFDAAVSQDGVTDLDLPDEIMTFVLMTLGMVIKGYRRERQQIIQVRHDGNAMNLLTGLFRGLGQTRSLPRLASDIEGLHDFPVWSAGLRSSSSLSMPCFSLTTMGLGVQRSYDAETLKRAAGTLRMLVRRVASSLLGLTEDHVWTRQPSVLYSNSLMLEAVQFLQEHEKLPVKPVLQAFEWVERMLNILPRERIEEEWKYDMQQQMVYCNLSALANDIDLTCVELEMRQLADKVEMKPGYRMSVDAYSAYVLLENYYGERPHLTPV
jgi:hypothetical protein